MTKNYKGSLRLDWINKDLSLYYEIDEKEGVGINPKWVPRNDISVSEPRILNYMQNVGNPDNENMLIKGDNLLVLRTLVEQFKNRKEKNKVKCCYIDPPFNTGNAFAHYQDNLKHSEWLTMMRDRLMLLKKLLRTDGAIFVHIDYIEFAHLKVLMDEIFGRDNFIQVISVRTATPAGFKTVNPGPVNVTEFILMYAFDRNRYKHKKLYVPCEWQKDYGQYIENLSENPQKWVIKKIKEYAIKELDCANYKEAKQKFGEDVARLLIDKLCGEFALNNSDRVFATYGPHKPSGLLLELVEKSKKDPEKIYFSARDEKEPFYLLNGRLFAFYSKKIKELDGVKTPTKLLTDFWDDMSWDSLSFEGGVEFKNSKKPERLLRRIIELSSEQNDLVLDSFAGSGTTGAVAHKMKRRWIMVELGEHAETLCLPRLKRVVSGEDQTGISKDLNWTGSGGFKYYKLGESLISESGRDINWRLTYRQIAEALFYAKNFTLIEEKEFEKKNIFIGENQNEKGTCALCIVTKDCESIGIQEYFDLTNLLRKKYSFSELNIYTNKAVNVRKEDMDKDVFIRKIPQTILKKYGMI